MARSGGLAAMFAAQNSPQVDKGIPATQVVELDEFDRVTAKALGVARYTYQRFLGNCGGSRSFGITETRRTVDVNASQIYLGIFFLLLRVCVFGKICPLGVQASRRHVRLTCTLSALTPGESTLRICPYRLVHSSSMRRVVIWFSF